MSIVKNVALALSTFFVCMLLSCSEERYLEEFERIKIVGDENPNKALSMLDSLEIGVRERGDYIKNKYDLLRIRLNDKADNLPSSDIMIKKLVFYFEDKGSILEKQEVFYYAGSVYRDLQDTPRSLEYFLKSVEYATAGGGCDSIMLRNAYSNLNDLYYKVQNYNDAVKMALKELEIAKLMKKDGILPYLHIGTSYLALHKLEQASAAFEAAFNEIAQSENISEKQTELFYLLDDFSALDKTSAAKKCLSLIDSTALEHLSGYPCMALAQYYESIGKNDSAIVCGKSVLDFDHDIYNAYDASKLLYRIYRKMGDMTNASHYAGIYMQLSDSLDFGKRQELAATVNNEFQYHLDQKKEQTLKDEKKRYKSTLTIVVMAGTLLASIAYILYVRRRNKHLKEVVALSAELRRMTNNEKQLRKDIEQKEMDLETSKESLEKSSDELKNVKRELQRVNEELSEYDEALKTKEQQLAEKMGQNKTFIKLLHQSELEGKAEDVIYAIRQSSRGMKDMKSSDWKQLYQAVDELYPSFKDRLLKELGNFTEQQMQVCYLMRIGLSKPQIQGMTNLSRVTVWRWVKKYDWVLTADDDALLAGQTENEFPVG